jgi:hypothetical protein
MPVLSIVEVNTDKRREVTGSRFKDYSFTAKNRLFSFNRVYKD